MKKKTKKRVRDVIYSSSISSLGAFEEIKKEFMECREITKEEFDEDYNDDNVYDWAYDLLSIYFDDLKVNMGSYGKDDTFLIIADLGLWDGRIPGGKIVKGLWNAICSTCSDTINIYEEKGVLKISSSHHDGTNSFIIYKLSKEGEVYYENNCYKDRRTLHQKLLQPRYRRNVNFVKNVYGC